MLCLVNHFHFGQAVKFMGPNFYSNNHIPTGICVAAISPDGPHCPWCPSTLNSTQHLFATCPITTRAWTWADNTARLLTNLLSPLTSHHSQSFRHQTTHWEVNSICCHLHHMDCF